MARQEKSAGSIIYYWDERPYFLLLKNTLKKTYWEFSKGHVEHEEKVEETAVREAEEETSLKNFQVIAGFRQVLRWFFRFQGELINKEATYILVKIPREDRNKVRISEEHQEFVWLDYKEARVKINIKSNREMLDKAYEFIARYEAQKKLL